MQIEPACAFFLFCLLRCNLSISIIEFCFSMLVIQSKHLYKPNCSIQFYTSSDAQSLWLWPHFSFMCLNLSHYSKSVSPAKSNFVGSSCKFLVRLSHHEYTAWHRLKLRVGCFSQGHIDATSRIKSKVLVVAQSFDHYTLTFYHLSFYQTTEYRTRLLRLAT